MSFELSSDGVLRWHPWTEIPWLVHGFTTRASGDFSGLAASPEDRALSAAAGSSPAGDPSPAPWQQEGLSLAMLRQIHSDQVLVIDNIEKPPPRPEGDGLVTNKAGLLLGIRTADCLPLLFVDRRSRSVAAVHAGWRGSARQIASQAVDRLEREFHVRPQDLEVVIGPGIGPCCYEVGPEVAAAFEDGAVKRTGRIHLDLLSANRSQLRQAGVPDASIRVAEMCTACSAGRFYSHRKEGAHAGRMLAVVGMRPTERANPASEEDP